MKLRRDAPALILGTGIVVVTAMAVFSFRSFAREMADVEEGQYALMRAIVDVNLEGGEDDALARAEILASLPAVREAFAARDRERLLQATRSMYQTQQDKFGLEELQFVTLDNVSFLRVHKPEAFGDDLSTFRAIVVQANQKRTAQKGISLTRTGPALVGVAPINDAAGKPTGLVELGLEFGPILDKLKAAYGFDCTFFVREEPLRQISTGVDPSLLDEHNRVGEYLKFHSTNWGVMKNLMSGRDLAKVDGEPVQYSRASLGIPYGLVLVSLHDSAGTPLGIIAAARDNSDLRDARGGDAVSQIAAALFAFLLLAGAVTLAIRGFLLRPVSALAEGMAALAQGKAAPPIDATGFCEELESLAASYESLRQAAVEDGAA